MCGSQFSERELCGNIGNACIVRERERESGKKSFVKVWAWTKKGLTFKHELRVWRNGTWEKQYSVVLGKRCYSDDHPPGDRQSRGSDGILQQKSYWDEKKSTWFRFIFSTIKLKNYLWIIKYLFHPTQLRARAKEQESLLMRAKQLMTTIGVSMEWMLLMLPLMGQLVEAWMPLM